MFQTIHKTELDDFEKSCQRKLLTSLDFSLKEKNIAQTPVGNGLFHTNGILDITRNSNNKTKSYNTGHGTHWAADFDADLMQGFFD